MQIRLPPHVVTSARLVPTPTSLVAKPAVLMDAPVYIYIYFPACAGGALSSRTCCTFVLGGGWYQTCPPCRSQWLPCGPFWWLAPYTAAFPSPSNRWRWLGSSFRVKPKRQRRPRRNKKKQTWLREKKQTSLRQLICLGFSFINSKK